jgi:hypothetical protein
MWGQAQLDALLVDVSYPNPINRTIKNTELVFAYIRHGGCTDTCLACLARMPRMGQYRDELFDACQAPITATKIRCIRLYSYLTGNVPAAVVRDLVYAMQFVPDLCELLIELMTEIDVVDQCPVIEALVECMESSPLPVRLAAAGALGTVCDTRCLVRAYLAPCVATIADLVPHGSEASALVCHIIRRVGDEANLSVALPALVLRGWHSESAVRAIGAIAVDNPCEVVRSGGLTTLLIKVGMAPDAIVSLYREDRACTCDHEVLAYMHCRVDLPPGADDTMRRIFNTSPMDVIHLYAKTYDLARPHIDAPPWPILPAFDMDHVGTVQLVSADGEAHMALLAPIARAAGFVAAHARNEPGTPIKVPLTSAKTVELLNALMYDSVASGQPSQGCCATTASAR